MKIFVFLILTLLFSHHGWAAVSSISSSFTPADVTRTHMDVGGVWNGTADVTTTTGDTFEIVIPNTGSDAFDLSPSVTLPADFSLVSGSTSVSQSGAGCVSLPSISASQAGSLITFDLSSYDQSADCTLTISYGLTTTVAASAGLFQVTSSVTFAGSEGGAQGAAVTDSINVDVDLGLVTLLKTPSQQDRAVGETADFEIDVCNTGTGGLFAVTVDESFISPSNPDGSLSLTTMTQTAPATPIATGSAPVLTLPYLGPGECFEVDVESTVTGCEGIDNEVATTDRTGATATTTTANVKLNLTTPLISYSAPTITAPAIGTNNISFNVTNNGMGIANGVVLTMTGLSADIVISNVIGNWIWDPGARTFTATGPLTNGAVEPLSFDVEKVGACPPISGSNGNYQLAATYTDGCGNAYTIPVSLGSYFVEDTNEPFSLSKSVTDNGGSSTVSRINIGESGTWTLNFTPGTAAEVATLNTDPLVITDVLPTGPTGFTLGPAPAGTTVTCSGGCVAGSTVEWTIPKAAMTTALSLEIDFTAPTDPCDAGTSVNNVMTTSYTYTSGMCSDSQSAGVDFFVTNTVGSTGSSSQSYNVSNIAGASVTDFETGLVGDSDLIEEHDAGEGDQIFFTNEIIFPGGFAGEWAGSEYTDTIGSLADTSLVSGSVTVTSPDIAGGTPQPVPGGSISFAPGAFLVNLAFLQGAGFFNDNNVSGRNLEIKYAVTANDSNLGGGITASVVSKGAFEIANTASGSGCGATANEIYSQAVGFNLFRRQLIPSLNIPSNIQVCEPFMATISSGGNAWDPQLILNEAPYEFISIPAPSFGGVFNASNMTYNENGGVNPDWTTTTSPFEQIGNGSISFQAVLPATSSTSPVPLSVSLNYDDSEELANGGLFFSATANDSPALVREGNLTITTTPSLVTVLSDQIQFSVYITNSGAGTAFNASVEDTLPSTFTPNKADSDTAGAGLMVPAPPVTVAGQTMTWAFGDLAPGETREVIVVADVNGSACTLPPNSNSIEAKWGCGSPFVNHQVATSNLPNFNFPGAQIQVLHDTSNTQVAMCDTDDLGRDVITFRNAGVTVVQNAFLEEVLNPALTGIDIVLGTSEISVNGGAWASTADPTGAGTSASPYRWDHLTVPELVTVLPDSEISIRFDVVANEQVNGLTPSVVVDGGGELTCGTAVSAPAPSSFNITVLKPDMTVTKVGRNLTTGGAFAETVYGKPTDEIEWRVVINNSGSYTASTLELTDDFPNTAGPDGVLDGPGHSGTNFPDASTANINDINSSNSSTYTLRQTLGSTCVDATNTASIQWGCTAPASLSTPSINTDTANLVMNPTFSSSGGSLVQTGQRLNNGRTNMRIVGRNGGAFAQNLSLTSTIPAGYEIDTSFTPTIASTGAISAVSLAGTSTVPIFNFTGTLENNETFTLNFRLVQNSNFDLTKDPLVNPETVGNGLDVNGPVTAPIVADLNYENGCGNSLSDSHSRNLNPRTPDMDISVSPSSQVVTDGTPYTFTFRVTNVGENSSVAEAVEFTPTLGAGWTTTSVTVTTVGVGGAGGACVGTCTAAQIGTLNRNAFAEIEVTGTANNNGSPLEIVGRVINLNILDDGTPTGVGTDFLSDDEARPKIIGYGIDKTIVSTNESFTSDPNLAVGEEVTWNLKANWFGLSGAETVTNIIARDSLPAGLGYVSHVDQAGNNIVYTFAGPTPVASGVLNYSFASLASPGGTIDVNVVSRLLNIGLAQSANVVNNFGLSFEYLGQTFASDNAGDGFGGSESDLHIDVTMTSSLPVPTFVKEVRNVTQGTGFGATVNAEAGEELEYRIQIGNTGNAPLFDLVVNDTLDGKLVLIDAAADGIANDGNGAPEGAFTAGAGGTILFDHTNTLLASGSSLERLDSGNTVILLYRATVGATANPSETLTNSASLDANTLPGGSGSQTAPVGASGDPDGEQTFNLTASADVNVDQVDFTKLINNTSVGGDTSLDVVIGEQVEFALDIVLPASAIPNFNVDDDVPAGMRLVSSPTVNVNSTTCTAPVITPAAPSSGAFGLNFNFGTCNVPSGLTDAQRTVSIRYTLQVENVSGNIESSTLVNRARYTFTGFSSPDSIVTMTVREPNISVFTKTASPNTALNAGDEVTYTVVVTNSGLVTARDLNIVDTLNLKTEYITSSTTDVSGPSMTEPSVSTNIITWGRARAPAEVIDLQPGQTLEFTYRVRLLNSIEPDETLTNSIAIDYTSLSGDPGPNLGPAVGTAGSSSGERTGSGVGDNTYRATASDDVQTDNTYSVSKVSSGDTLTPDGFRVGDIVTYTIELNLQEGTTDALVLSDSLPLGLEFFDVVSLLPASSTGVGSINYTTPTNPTAGDTSLSWSFGTVVVDGDNSVANDKLTLVYRAIVVNTGGVSVTPATQSLNNSADFAYQLESGAAASSNTSVDSIDVKQPVLTTVKTLTGAQPSEIEAGDTVNFTVTVSNSGTAPSYNTIVTDTLPQEMRDTAPSFISATLNGAPLTLGAPTWNPGTGLATWSLNDTDAIDPSGDLVINYQATVDSDVGAGQAFTNSARVESSSSLPSSTTSTERRTYVAGATDSANLTTAAPTDMEKSVDVSEANIGETITYTLTVPNTTVPTVLYDVNISDILPTGLEIVSVNTNGGALGVTVNDTSTTSTVAVEFEEIPKSAQAVVTVEARVQNTLSNQTTLDFDNTASYQWSGIDGGVQQPVINSPTRTVDITEPDLNFVKTFTSQSVADPSIGLQTGDTVTYTIRIENSGDGDAHDLTIRDLADENLTSPVVTANPDNPGAPINSGTALGVTTWVWSLPGTLVSKTSGVYQFDVTFTLGSGVEPFMNLNNTGGVSYTSAAGSPIGERDGSGGVNDYTFDQAVPVTVQTGNIKLNKRIKAPAVTTYGVGSEFAFELVAEFGLGEVDGFHFIDALPTGLEFVSASVVSTNMQTQAGGAIAIVSGPAAGDIGSLDFEIGDLRSTGANPNLILELTARVQDVAGNVDAVMLNNTADATLEDPDDGSTVTINSATSATVEVIESNLLLNLDGPTNVDLGAQADFQARVVNTGRQAAYQPKIEIEIPTNLRGADPTASTLAVAISGGRSLTFVSGTDYTTSYDASTGRFVVTLISAQAFIAQNETLTIDFKIEPDSGAATTTGSAYQMLATVSDFGSQDSSGGVVPDNRLDTTTFGTGTVGTGNATNGDDQNDDHNFDVRAPQLVLTKSVDSTIVTPGDTLTYTVSLVNSGAIDAEVTTLTDDMAIHFEPGTLTLPVVTGATATSVTFDSNGGVNSTGTWTVSGLTIPNTGTAVDVTFTVQTQRPLASGTQIFNQATADIAGYSTPFVSDSANASDDDGVENGNDAGDPDDDDPTLSTVASAPDITLLKNSVVSSPPLSAGGEITYTITASNSGDENLVNVILQDAIPANTTYVAGSTVKDPNGTPLAVPDVGGTSALVAGLSVDGPTANTLEVDQTVEYSFKVTVDGTVTNGTVITNQAFINGEGEGSGAIPPVPSDDPDTTFGPDPTQDVVGSAPALYATKEVVDVNGGSLIDGEILRYSIVARNNGSTTISNLDFIDVIPANTTFVPGTISFDDDNLGANPPVIQSDALDGDLGDFTGSSVHVALGDLAASAEVRIDFEVTVDLTTTPGTVISNTGTFTGDGIPNTNTDSDSNPGNGDQPTDIVVGDQGVLRVTKEVSDSNGGTVEPGDDLVYTIRVSNIGTQTATGIVITDPMPTPISVAYVPGTTTLNSVVQTDVLGSSPLIVGLNIGNLAASADAVISYKVNIPVTEPIGTLIRNQATYSSADAGSGVSDSDRNDGVENGNDASNPNDDDPTEVQIGGAPGVASVSGSIWQDTDHDRVQNGSEPVEEGWTVEVLLGALVVGTDVSDANGDWSINGLAPGSGYTVRFRHPVSGNIFGGAQSSEPGVDLSTGTIRNLTLPSGLTILDQNLPLDPSGVVYDAVSRRPVSGARVAITGPPGFDPVTETLQGVGELVTANDGYYRYDLQPSAPAGDYTLTVTVPPGYLPNISSLIAPTAAVCDPLSPVCNPGALDPFTVALSNEAPVVGSGDTTYYLTFTLDASNPATPDVVNNHIPIDPILRGAITVVKTATKKNVTTGAFSNYNIRVENTLNVSLGNLDVEDLLPPGFIYVPGSAIVGGTHIEPEIDGRTLRWRDQTFAAGEVRVYKIATVVGAAVRQGTSCNTAQVRQNIVDQVITDLTGTTHIACVRVVPDPTFDCPDLIGKVFDDKNKNGYQDKGEQGLPGVKIITTKGWIINADQYGRYHIACPIQPNIDRGSNFAVKVDSSSLPTGYRLTTENPKVVRLTRGKLSKANFGASVHRVIGIDLKDAAYVNGELDQKWRKSIPQIAEVLSTSDSVVRITYDTSETNIKEVKKRVKRLKKLIVDECKRNNVKRKILFEDFIYKGGAK